MDSNIDFVGAIGPMIGSFNCNGLGNKQKRDLVLNWLKEKQEDIFLLQETHSTTDLERDWLASWEGRIFFNHGASNSTGTAILIKNSANHVIAEKHTIICQGRASLLEIEIEGIKYCISNVYAPNNDSIEFVENVFTTSLERYRDDHIIFGGDWNTVLSDTLDKRGGAAKHKSQKTQKFLNAVMLDYGFSDIFRLSRGGERLYSHFNKKCKTSTRLDFFLIDDRLVNFPVCETNITHGFKSDHSYVSLKLQGSGIKHGRGYWKFNNSLLKDKKFMDETRALIGSTANDSFDSYRGLWDVIKFQIKDKAIRFGKIKKKEQGQEKEKLLKKIEDMKKISDVLEKDDLRKELFEAQCKVDKITSDELQGNIIRSRVNWTEKGERSTKYFFGLEKSKGKKKTLTKISSNNGNLLYDQSAISDEVTSFYQQLYTSRNPSTVDIDDYLESTDLESVPDDLKSLLEDDIIIEELDKVVNNLKNNKSPGWDGLSAELYKALWPDIRNILYNVYRESIDSGTLSPSQRIGILTLIPKPKPPTELIFLKNWRPITLLNIDYKIFTHIIKNRLVKALPTVISNVQTGFQAGKSTCDNLILMALTLDFFHENEEEEGLILEIDYEKAFDSVEHMFLFKTLKAMGFGDYIIRLIKIAFTGCMTYANVNGYLSDPIYLLRGLHQGSPLSPILFLIVAQVFTVRVYNNTEIEGLTVSGVHVMQSLFADDTDLFLKASARCVSAVVEELQLFGDRAGCRPNMSKTRCIPLGKAKTNVRLLEELTLNFGSDFLSNSFTALGLRFDNSSSLAEITHTNYELKLEKAKGWVKNWSRRDLTLYGKITIIKSLILSQFSYLAVPLPRPSDQMIKSIDSLVYHFLWGCKRDKIKRDLVARPISFGGLNLFPPKHFIKGLKCSTLTKLFDNNFTHLWKDIIVNQLKYPDLPRISVESRLVKRGCNYTTDLISCFNQWKEEAATRLGGSVNHCVWGNERITDIGAKLWNDKLISRGVMYITDFLSDSYSILNYNDFLTKWGLTGADVSANTYVNIKMAIRRYDCPTSTSKAISHIEKSYNLTFIKPQKATPGRLFREAIGPNHDMDSLTPLNNWSLELKRSNIDWSYILHNSNKNVTNNFKLIQFQYKLLMRISTCKLMRLRMGIVKDNGLCRHCNELETLNHIFFSCYHTTMFINSLNNFIRTDIDREYSDRDRYFLLTCAHDNQCVNFINMAGKWFISRQFHRSENLMWDLFLKFVRSFLIGEKIEIKRIVQPMLDS